MRNSSGSTILLDVILAGEQGGAEEHQSIGVGIAHRNFLLDLLAGGLFHVTTESEPHRGQYPVLVIRLAARGETLV